MNNAPRTMHARLAAGMLASTLLMSACIGVSQKRSGGGTPGASKPAPVLGKAALAAANVRTCPGATRPADDGDLDDFEDKDTQLTRISGRDGYWWTKKDDQGSTIEPKPFKPEEGGVPPSTRALRGFGVTTSADGAWGAGFGANFSTKNPYDGARYVGIAFKAKIGPNSTQRFRFKIGDVNTHKDAGVCKESCWNHFGQDLEFTTEWKEYKVLFSESPQEAGWGSPRPPSVTPSKLYSLDWSIGTGQTYDLWVDDIYFLDCK